MLTARQLQRTKDGHANGLNFMFFKCVKIRHKVIMSTPNVMLTARQLQRTKDGHANG